MGGGTALPQTMPPCEGMLPPHAPSPLLLPLLIAFDAADNQECSDRLAEHCTLSFLATILNEISSFRQSRNKLNMISLFRFCRKDEISRKTRSTLLPETATMSKQRSSLSNESFDL